jgi:hypothetical protein
VGCLEHCYGTTTLDTSGLTLAQIEQLLDELHVPSPPTVTAAPGDEQNTTQQTAAQSENNDGGQSQTASQSNGTVQVVVTPGGAAGDGGSGAAVVNQTAQGIVQLQVGCIFYCSRTQQTQQAQQSNATVQSADGSGAAAVNTVSRVVWQVQVGCLAWCYDAVETQTATGSDSTVASVPPPSDGPPADVPPADLPPVEVPPANVPVASAPPPPTPGVRTRTSGGAPVGAPGGDLGVGSPDRVRPVLGSPRVAAGSVSSEAGNGTALVSVASSQMIQTVPPQRTVHRRRAEGPRRAPGAGRVLQLAEPESRSRAVPQTTSFLVEFELALALVLVALAVGVWRHRGVR